jgi:subtilisin family serine protease
MRKLFTIMVGTMLLTTSLMAGSLSNGLERYLADMQDNDMVTVMLAMQEQVDVASISDQLHRAQAPMAERHFIVMSTLQQTAASSQTALLADLEQLRSQNEVEGWTSHWLSNMVIVRATVATVRQLAARSDVEQAEVNLVIQSIDPVYIDTEKTSQPTRGVQEGVDNIEADRVWYELGVFGETAIVAGIDTGVMGSHVSFSDRWQGNGAVPDSEGWLDLLGSTTTPSDGGGHGTHTMGTMVGASSDTIGVAPGANWIATNPINQGTGGAFDSDIIAALAWVCDPDGNPGTVDDMADVAQNSWGVNENFSGYYDCDSRWWTAIDNCEAIGTVLTWSAGNEGTSGLRSPADRATTPYNCFSVGSTLRYPPFTISSFSSRGPSGCGGPYEVKPEICAPGSDIYSAYNNGGYTTMSGTSMAGPHIAGVVALMRSANPDIDVETIKQILMDTAIDLGTTGEDNTYGWGFVDAYEAVLAVMEGYGTLQGTVTSSDSGLPIELASVETNDGHIDETDINGDYSMSLASGSYTLEFSAFGYITDIAGALVPEDGVVTVDMALTPGPSATLSGHVYDPEGVPMSGAQVQVLDTPIVPVYTDGSGYYTLDMPTGAVYDVRAWSAGWGADQQSVNFTGNMTVNFTLIELVLEDFESGNFDVFPWEMSGDAPWIISSDAYEGSWCAKSGDIDNYDTSTMSVVLNTTANGDITFQYKVSSESNYDFLRFYIDGTERGNWDGEQGWAEFSYPVSAGEHTFTWSYTKDVSVSNGDDCGWIDYIVFPPIGAPALPDIAVSPALYDVTLEPGGITVEPLNIENSGDGELSYSILVTTDGEPTSVPYLELRKGEADPRQGQSPRDQGGPDGYGNFWIDSDEAGGPVYNWVEINGVGTIPGSGDDGNYGPFGLGFNFDFYGTTYDAVNICTNGFLSFTSTATTYTNQGIPNSADPNCLVAPFWDDLNPSTGGTIYYYADAANQRFIVEWDGVNHYYDSSPETFQVILNADGTILYQYQTVALNNGCTIGIENQDGNDGLQIVFNADYLHSNMAILITNDLSDPWLSVSPLSGTVAPYGDTELDVTFDATELTEGVYTGSVTVNSNDPDEASILIPVTLTVGSTMLDPVDDLILTVSGTVGTLSWSAAAGATYYKVYESLEPYGAYDYLGQTGSTSWSVPVTAEKRFYHVVAGN